MLIERFMTHLSGKKDHATHFAIRMGLVVWLTMFGAEGLSYAGDAAGLFRTLRVSVTGLQDLSLGSGTLSVMAMNLSDGSVASSSFMAKSHGQIDVSLQVPMTRVLVTVLFTPESAQGSAEGQIGEYAGQAVAGIADEHVLLDMMDTGLRPDASTSSVDFKSHGLTMRPPKEGKAIGFNELEFKASGKNLGHQGRGLSHYMVSLLGESPCMKGTGDDRIRIVESANPGKMAELIAELEFRQSPYCDPAYRAKPDFIAPTHMANGSVMEEGDQVTVSYQITDLAGNVIAAGSSSGPAVEWTHVAENAMAALSEELCGPGEGWRGTVTYEEHSALNVPNVDPDKPGGSISGDISFRCSFTPNSTNSTASYKDEIKGAEGHATTSGSGAVDAMVSVSEVDGRMVVEIGLFSMKCNSSASIGGGSHSGVETVQLGGWRGEGPAKPKSSTQSGSFSESFNGGRRTITWMVTKKGGS